MHPSAFASLVFSPTFAPRCRCDCMRSGAHIILHIGKNPCTHKAPLTLLRLVERDGPCATCAPQGLSFLEGRLRSCATSENVTVCRFFFIVFVWICCCCRFFFASACKLCSRNSSSITAGAVFGATVYKQEALGDEDRQDQEEDQRCRDRLVWFVFLFWWTLAISSVNQSTGRARRCGFGTVIGIYRVRPGRCCYFPGPGMMLTMLMLHFERERECVKGYVFLFEWIRPFR